MSLRAPCGTDQRIERNELLKYKNTEKVVSRSCSISTLSAPAVLTEYIHDHLPVTINEMKTTAITKEKSVTFVSRALQINRHGKPLTRCFASCLNLDILPEHSYLWPKYRYEY